MLWVPVNKTMGGWFLVGLQPQQLGQLVYLGLALSAGQPVAILVQGELDGVVAGRR